MKALCTFFYPNFPMGKQTSERSIEIEKQFAIVLDEYEDPQYKCEWNSANKSYKIIYYWNKNSDIWIKCDSGEHIKINKYLYTCTSCNCDQCDEYKPDQCFICKEELCSICGDQRCSTCDEYVCAGHVMFVCDGCGGKICDLCEECSYCKNMT